ncbi:MAG: hypothetical protein ABSF09_10455 [Candidatus Bathyarchaeia archaeon]
MSSEKTVHPRRINYQSIILLVIVALAVGASGLALAVVSTTFQAPPADFVTLPSTPRSTSGVAAGFSQVSSIVSQGVAVGVKGYLLTSSGSPVAGASVFMTYYFQGSYRTQVAVTDANGYFEARFHMNWTGWLPLTLVYLGDAQHKGLTQIVSVSGENLVIGGFSLLFRD